ncbi:MAG: C39 family peptidase [Candidatus Magasanikbacteria bacterium]
MLCLIFFSLPTIVDSQILVRIPVPYVSQTPLKRWVRPWSEACEEASIMMVDQYYLGNTSVSITKARAYLSSLFTWENLVFGYNQDTNAEEILQTIQDKASFQATIVRAPTLEEIKQQLEDNHPVISLHYGVDLFKDSNTWLRNSPYHVIVLIGFDDKRQVFIAQDPARNGYSMIGLRYAQTPYYRSFTYSYETIMSSLHDFDHTTVIADGLPTVIFTQQKAI